ncbi:MAG: efflux RND transporter periplasmic adaptor subunit [Clostridia bacterium]|nr:efflux RND transporter periplasmic adaptor subunit [Clostridia bacterium]
MKKRGKFITLLICICALAALTLPLAGCSLFNYGDKEDEVALATPIKIEYKMYNVIKGDIKREFTGVCKVESLGAVKHSYRSAGFPLEGYAVRTGQTVKKGDVLASLKVDAILGEIEAIELRLETEVMNDWVETELRKEKAWLENQVKQKDLIATVDGTVTYINTKYTIGKDHLNDNVEAGEVLVVVDPQEMSNAQGIMYVDSSIAKKYTLGLNSDVVLTTASDSSGQKKSFDAKVVGASNTVYWDTDTVTYYIDLSNAPAEVKVGDRLSVRFEEDNQAIGVVKIPVSALYTFEGRHYVYVLDSQGLRRECYVEVGISDDTFVEIKSGLEVGQQVVMY